MIDHDTGQSWWPRFSECSLGFQVLTLHTYMHAWTHTRADVRLVTSCHLVE